MMFLIGIIFMLSPFEYYLGCQIADDIKQLKQARDDGDAEHEKACREALALDIIIILVVIGLFMVITSIFD